MAKGLLDLLHEVVDEILFRLPPDEPQHLVRCAAVCKRWRRLLTNRDFLGRYRAFHGGVPPILGFLFDVDLPRDRFGARFDSTTAFRPRTQDHAGCYVRDARHGRVLFSNETGEETDHDLFVWSPVTGERWELNRPDRADPFTDYWNVAVLCAAAARQDSGDCDHLDCHGGPFLVAFVDIDDHHSTTHAQVYSSETREWSDKTDAQHPDGLGIFPMDAWQPSTLVGNRIYFSAKESTTFVEYDLGRRELAFVDPPSAHQGHGILMPAMGGGGGLGFAGLRGPRLYLWSRETTAAAAWTQSRVLELNTLLVPGVPTTFGPWILRAVGFAEGLGVIFVNTSAGMFSINLESDQVKEMPSRMPGLVIIPYRSFYTPDHATGLPPVP